jgi:hypothetical protein
VTVPRALAAAIVVLAIALGVLVGLALFAAIVAG